MISNIRKMNIQQWWWGTFSSVEFKKSSFFNTLHILFWMIDLSFFRLESSPSYPLAKKKKLMCSLLWNLILFFKYHRNYSREVYLFLFSFHPCLYFVDTMKNLKKSLAALFTLSFFRQHFVPSLGCEKKKKGAWNMNGRFAKYQNFRFIASHPHLPSPPPPSVIMSNKWFYSFDFVFIEISILKLLFFWGLLKYFFVSPHTVCVKWIFITFSKLFERRLRANEKRKTNWNALVNLYIGTFLELKNGSHICQIVDIKFNVFA